MAPSVGPDRLAAGGSAGRRRDAHGGQAPGQRHFPDLVAGGPARGGRGAAAPAPLAALVLAPPLLDWLDRRPPLDPGRYVIARLLDDIAYSLGVWQGCAELRTARPLLPLVATGKQPSPASP